MTAMIPTRERDLPGSLSDLMKLLDGRIHLLASEGDEPLGTESLQATKDLFDLGVSLEPLSHPHLQPFLLSILQPPPVSLRSSIQAPSEPKPKDVLPYTPLSVLTIDGLDIEQIWRQLELRAAGVGRVIKEVGAGEAEADEDDEGNGGSEGEEGSEGEMTVEEFKRMIMEDGESEGSESGSESEGSDSETSEDEDSGESDESLDGNEFRLKGELGDEEDGDLSDEDEEDGDVEVEEGDEDDSEEERELDEDNEIMDGDSRSASDEEVLGIDGMDDEAPGNDNTDDEAPGVDEDDETARFGAGPSRRRSRKTHPTLDDTFFSIDDFNRLTEEAEAGRVSAGRLGGDEDDEEELADVGSMMLQGGDQEDSVMYGDFFEAPKAATSRRAGPIKGNANKGSKGKGKRKGHGVRFDEEQAEDEGIEEEADEEQDDGRGIIGRLKGDLFDDDEEEADEQNMSTHERRQLALAKQIAELEQEAIGPKDWTLLGEASSRARPENSLLEEDLDFEQVGKVVPVVTEDTVKTLEEMIKTRIRDNNFNSPIRVRAYEPTPFLPSRYFELQDKQSEKSLAQIYEEEYQNAASGGRARDPRDEKLKKEHEEIERLWGDICYKLDALSSLNFVPKQPKAQINTISNLPTTTLESALPPTSAATTLLAPEELFAPPNASALVSRSELTPEEKHRARSKSRKSKQVQTRKLSSMTELYGKKKGTKAEKDKALAGLVKTGKGVTVVGKGGKGTGKVRKREEEVERSDGKRLKL